MDELLSVEDYKEILKNKYNNLEIKFVDAKIVSQTGELNGYLGEHSLLELTYDLNNKINKVNFFVKSKPKYNEVQNNMANELQAYEKEVFFYKKLLNEFDKRGYNTSFAPKLYMSKNDEILVLEDLKSQGYTLSGRTNFYDVNKVKSSLKALAYFHGCSFIFEEHKSFELGLNFRLVDEFANEFEEKFLLFQDSKNIGRNYFKESINCFINLIKLFTKSDKWKNEYIEYLKKINFHELFNYDLNIRKACGHGDLWSNNMLFKKKEDNKIDSCILLDYQTLRYYNPAFDVIYIIYANTRKILRDQYLHDFFQYYHDTLTEILKQQNVDINTVYSRGDYEKSIKYYEFFVRFQTACAHTLTFLDINKIKKFMEEKSLTDLIFSERPKLVCEAFKYDDYFQEIMIENLYELRDFLIEYHCK